MKNNVHFFGDLLWNDFVQACKDRGYIPSIGLDSAPQYKRLVYNQTFHLLTFEVRRSELPGFPEGVSGYSEMCSQLEGFFGNLSLKIIDLDSLLYIYCWVVSIESNNQTESNELVFV